MDRRAAESLRMQNNFAIAGMPEKRGGIGGLPRGGGVLAKERKILAVGAVSSELLSPEFPV